MEKFQWKYSEADFNTLNRFISEANWNFIDNHCLKNDEVGRQFMDKLDDLLTNCIPRRKFILRPYDKYWMNSQIRCEQRKRDRAHKKAKQLNTPEAWARYRSLRNHVTYIIKKLDLTMIN